MKTLFVSLVETFVLYSTQVGKTNRKILSFLSLDDGWSYGYGTAPALMIVLHAMAIDSFLNDAGVELTDAFPGEDGSVLVTGYIDDYTIEVYCESNGVFKVVLEKGDDEINVELCESMSAAVQEINKRVQLWDRSRDYSTQSITTKQNANIGAPRFNHPITKAGHQLLIFPV